jgi:hypothetical protein
MGKSMFGSKSANISTNVEPFGAVAIADALYFGGLQNK